MSEETRQRILTKGAELIHRQGYNNTGIKQILDAAQVPKGSFYFYFGSKEDFGLAVVEYHEALFRDRVMQILIQGEGGPLTRLRAFFEYFRAFFAEAGYCLGCPIGNLAQEMGDLSPIFQQRLEKSMRGLTRVISRVLAEAGGLGELPEGLDPGETAMFMVEAWHGALARMKVAKNAEPLDVCHKMLFERLLG
ncbi:MAG: TetR/AcrR family transcriptional regulator, partial [Proteobacteria bacterium]|nr:TetR/AcrR family transcriptional regulator [Pseudomonadota bacterium]MBU1610944.1 TetR/AcrR family transcriptional regulator [Pseudomonadota bacterium]